MSQGEALVPCPRCGLRQPLSEWVCDATCRLCWHLVRKRPKGTQGRHSLDVDPHTPEGWAMEEAGRDG